jgi:hypothetical protein
MQQRGLNHERNLLFIRDADTQARWYHQLKNEFSRAQDENPQFRQPSQGNGPTMAQVGGAYPANSIGTTSVCPVLPHAVRARAGALAAAKPRAVPISDFDILRLAHLFIQLEGEHIYARADMSADLVDAAVKNGAEGIVVAGVDEAI